MIDEGQLSDRFHVALDVEPSPGAYDRLRAALVVARVKPRPRPWISFTLPRLTLRVAALLMAVILALAAATAFLAFNEYAHRVIHVKPQPGGAVRLCGAPANGPDMITDRIGWQGTTRTTDGGVTWRDVSPPSVDGWIKGGGATCTLDPNHAWVLQAAGTVAYQPDHFVVSSTSDGGQTWENSEPIPVGMPMTWRGNSTVVMTFLDDWHGWLLMDTGTASSPQYVRSLYASSDGGLTWSRVVTAGQTAGGALGHSWIGCDETAITFVTPNRGWISFNCNTPNIATPTQTGQPSPIQGPAPLAVTNDGGKTWAATGLPSTLGSCAAGQPVLSGDDGVLPISCPQLTYFRTKDGGTTWSPITLPADGSLVDFVNGTTGYLFHVNPQRPSSNDLYRTGDGGATWTSVRQGLFKDDQVTSFQFIDTDTGFANTGSSPAPWWTHDGGKTWSLPAPYRSVGTTVCALPTGAPGPPFNALQMFSPSTGWASGGWRSVDGGGHWSNAGPNPVPERALGYGEFFLDAEHAWVAESAGSAAACADHVDVLATTDGGVSWDRVATLKAGLPVFPAGSSSDWHVSLAFANAEDGWLYAQLLQGCISVCTATPATLYRTSDGGHHWVIVSQQVQDATGCSGVPPMAFSAATGWMSASCAGGNAASKFFVTMDGGRTWKLHVFEPATCCATLPQFTDASHGWVADANNNFLAVTSSGGVTWTRRSLPAIVYHTCYFGAALSDLRPRGVAEAPPPGPYPCSDTTDVAVTFADPANGWAVLVKQVGGGNTFVWYVERTADGGRSWRQASASMPLAVPGQVCETLDFVDTSHGFCWMGGSDLRVTYDGGRTWRAVKITGV